MKPYLLASSVQHADTLHGTVPAALLSPFLSCIGIVCYERWHGSAVNLNLFKCSFAASLFAIVVSAGPPTVLTPLTLRMLVLSAFLGVVVGDVLWLQALKLLGVRLTVLMSTLQPLLAALAGAVFLKQPLTPSAALGIAAVCSGLALAQYVPPPPSLPFSSLTVEYASGSEWSTSSSESVSPQADETSERVSGRSKLALGILLNVINLGFDIAGTVLTRRYGTACTTWQINLVRFGSAAAMTGAGCVSVLAWSALTKPGSPPPEWAALAPAKQPARVWLIVAAGVLLVTFLSPALGNHALFGLPLGIWSALSSLGPVWSIPVLLLIKRERTSPRGLAGAALAVAGAITLSRTASAPL